MQSIAWMCKQKKLVECVQNELEMEKIERERREPKKRERKENRDKKTMKK